MFKFILKIFNPQSEACWHKRRFDSPYYGSPDVTSNRQNIQFSFNRLSWRTWRAMYDTAEWVTVNTGNDRTVRDSPDSFARKPVRLCDTVTVCQDEWHTTSHRPDLRNYGHTGDFDNRVHNLDHPVLIILIHEEGGCRISPARPPSQCGEMEERRTSELTRLREPSNQVEFDIRSHNSVKSPFYQSVKIAVCTVCT